MYLAIDEHQLTHGIDIWTRSINRINKITQESKDLIKRCLRRKFLTDNLLDVN